MNKVDNNREAANSSGLPRARARFLAQAIELEEEGVSDIVKSAVYVIMGMMVYKFQIMTVVCKLRRI